MITTKLMIKGGVAVKYIWVVDEWESGCLTSRKGEECEEDR